MNEQVKHDIVQNLRAVSEMLSEQLAISLRKEEVSADNLADILGLVWNALWELDHSSVVAKQEVTG